MARKNQKARVIGTYAEVFKRDFLEPGSEHYMNNADLESRIERADKLGLLDMPYVEHEFSWNRKKAQR